jgi:subtilisin-like proprotein convertase family protein
MVSVLSGTGPVLAQLLAVAPSTGPSETALLPAGSNGVLTLDQTLTPPLNPGLYALELCNQGPDLVTVSNFAALGFATNPTVPIFVTATSSIPILDDALSLATLYVTNNAPILSLDVGVRIQHPRVSDLVLHLVSPTGTRVLLDQNRGGDSPAGMGLSIIVTNITPVSFNGGAVAVTNTFDTGQNEGVINIAYDMYALPDDMRVYYAGQLLYDSGYVSFTGLTNLSYGPGPDTTVTIVMNQNGNPYPNTAWRYTVTATRPDFIYVTFTENTNLATVPIQFAVPPFTNVSQLFVGGVVTNGIFYLPEESLAKFNGQSALGPWRLEMEDTRVGATNPAPALLGWRLALVLAATLPVPIVLAHDQPANVTLGAGDLQYFTLDVPAWATFLTNDLLAASAPVNLLFNQGQPPSGTNGPGDFCLLAAATNGTAVLSATNGSPSLVPGQQCYLAIQNTNPGPVTFSFTIAFNVTPLTNNVPLSAILPGGDLPPPRYFSYDVSPAASAVSFQLINLSGNADLYAQFGLPFPDPASGTFAYSSTNPGTNAEFIAVDQDSFPVPLAPGCWYLGVFNADVTNVAYTILATEYCVSGTNNIAITDCDLSASSLCVTWTSWPGLYYYLAGATNYSGPYWTPVSHTIVATDFITSFCIPLPSSFLYFCVESGLAPATNLPPVSFTGISATNSGFQLQWGASTNSQFQVQWSPTLAPSAWTTLPGVITSATGQFSFLDDGSQTGGLDVVRFYRLLQLP